MLGTKTREAAADFVKNGNRRFQSASCRFGGQGADPLMLLVGIAAIGASSSSSAGTTSMFLDSGRLWRFGGKPLAEK